MANLYVISFGLMLANGMVLFARGQVTNGTTELGGTSATVPTTIASANSTVVDFSTNGTTELGSTSTTVSVTTATAPCTPNGSVSNITGISMIVSWSASSCPSGSVAGFFVCYELSDRNDTKMCFNETNNTTRTISSLQSFTTYRISVFAYTSVSNGSAWTSVITTLESTPCAPSGSVSKLTNSSMVVSWSASPCSNSTVIGYFVCYEQVDTSSFQKMCFYDSKNTTNRTLSSLRPFTRYNITVFGYASVGNGSAWTNISTTLESTPSAPFGSVSDVTNSSMVVSWSAPSSPNGIVNGYFVCYKTVSSSSQQTCFSDLKDARNRTLISLLPFTNYSISVFSYTSAGNGSAWTSLNATSESKPCAPSSLWTTVTNDSMAVSWSPPNCSNGILQGYFVCYESTKTSVATVCIKLPSDMTKRQITYLEPFTNYSVSVFGFTAAGNGSALTIVNRTLESTPCPPSGSVTVLTDRSLVVSWSAPSCPNGVVIGYFVCYEPTNKSIEKLCFNDVNGTMTRTISILQPFTAYSISVFGYTSVGNGSAWTNVSKTFESTPGPPTGSVTTVTNDSMIVSWSEPSDPNGVLLGYFVCYESIENRVETACFNLSSDTRQRQLSSLKSFTNYSLSVFGYTSIGNGSALTIFSKTSESIPCAPGSVSTTGVTSTGMSISWLMPTCLNGILLGYNVCYQPEKTGTPVCYSIPVNSTSYVISSLRPYTVYSISVYSYNSAGSGPAALWSQKTAAAQPESPLTIMPPNEQPQPYKIVIAWQPVQNSWGEILRYDVTCSSAKASCPKASYSVSGNQTSLEITELARSTTYTLKVSACTIAGCGNYTVYEFSTSEDVPLVAGLSIGVTLFALIVILIAVILLHRRKKWPFATPNDGTHTQFSMMGTRKTRPIRLESLPDRVAEMHADSNLLFHDEYEELRALSPKHSCDAASLQGNTAKNRYVDILPFDHSRVKLLPLADEEGSDYINANYMPGYSSRREFIAAQGPLPGTVDHFWRMIWEQNVSVVVMLTQLIEKGKRKCDQYWPEAINESLIYGDLTVTKIAETSQQSNSTAGDFCVRTLQVSLNEYSRQVTLLCYLSWPDFGCPQTTDTLLNFVAVFRSYMALGAKGPAIVHCSAGVGRTGTFICLDHMLQQIRVKSEVDIFGTVLDMRNSRTRMVQTEDQYIYIHDCVRDALLRGMSPFYNPEKSSSLYANDDGSQYINYDPKPRPTSRGFRNSSRASSSEGLVKD